MNGLFKHFLLIALLIFHVSWGSVVATNMFTTTNSMPSSQSHNKVATLDRATENPCPNHAINMMSESSVENTAMTQCSDHDCSDCSCVNVVSSIPTVFTSLANVSLDRSHIVAFNNAIFPDSPPSYILRPPIS